MNDLNDLQSKIESLQNRKPRTTSLPKFPKHTTSYRWLQIANKLAEGLPLKEISNQLNHHSSTISVQKPAV